MKKLIIAYDGSSGADAALDDLSRAGLPTDLQVMVVSVADVWLPAESDSTEAEFSESVPEAVRKARAEALAAVERTRVLAQQAAEALKQRFSGWTLEGVAAADSPAWAVVKRASSWRADLIVLGSHGRSVLERLFLGSTAQKVAAEADCSVRVVRRRHGGGDSPLRLMIGVDGSADSELAVGWVAERRWPDDTEFRLVTVIDAELQSSAGWPSAYPEHWIKEGDRGADDWVQRMMTHSAQQLAGKGRTVETEMLRGEPKQQLLREAERWDADCLFLGARGWHHRGRLFLGTTASAVAARAGCTVEIVRVSSGPLALSQA